MLKACFGLISIFLVSLAISAQDAFVPRDGNEALAMRIHNSYRASQARLAQLYVDRAKVRGFINEVAPSSTFVGTAVAPEDTAALSQINAEIALQEQWCTQLEVYWSKNRAVPPSGERSFLWRYGSLSDVNKPSSDPRYDQVEAAIRNFPFASPSPVSSTHTDPITTGVATLSGTWNVTFNGTGGVANTTMVLTQTGTSVSGSLVTTDGTPGQIRGTFIGKTLSLSRDTGLDTIQYYQVTVEGNRFSGTFHNEGKYPDRGRFSGIKR